jgi:hypothetical protein
MLGLWVSALVAVGCAAQDPFGGDATNSVGSQLAASGLYSIRVTSYGALCNGIANDTTAFQQAILAANNATSVVEVPTGTCLVNLVMPQIAPYNGGVTLQGQGSAATFLEPYANAPVITFNSTSYPLQGFTIRNLSMNNVKNYTSSAMYFTGDGINDHHTFEHVGIGYAAGSKGFETGINIAGRTIWTRFDSMHIGNTIGRGVSIAGDSGQFVGELDFNGVVIEGVGSDCFYANGSLASNGGLVNVHIENSTLQQCEGAGLIMNNFDGLEINNTDFESNKGDDIKLGGSIARAVSIHNNTLLRAYAGNSVEFNASLSQGTVDGNYFIPGPASSCVLKLSGVNGSISNVTYNGNSAGPLCVSPDASANTALSSVSPLIIAAKAANTSSPLYSATPSVGTTSHIEYYNPGALTITNLLDGVPGQEVTFTVWGSGSVTFNSNPNFFIPGGSITIGQGEIVTFFLSTYHTFWVPKVTTSGIGVSAGTITLAGGTGRHSFAKSYGAVPVCTLGPTASGNTYKVAATPAMVTITSSSTQDVSSVDWICSPPGN